MPFCWFCHVLKKFDSWKPKGDKIYFFLFALLYSKTPNEYEYTLKGKNLLPVEENEGDHIWQFDLWFEILFYRIKPKSWDF